MSGYKTLRVLSRTFQVFKKVLMTFYLQVHMTVNWSPGYNVTLGIWVLLWFQRYLHLCDRIPSVAELGFVKPAHVPHERNLNIGVPHVLHVYLRESLVLGQCLYDKSLCPSFPNKPTKAPLQDPVLVGLIHNLPINDPNCHDKKDSNSQASNSPLPGLVHLFQPRVPCHLWDWTRVPVATVWHDDFTNKTTTKKI